MPLTKEQDAERKRRQYEAKKALAQVEKTQGRGGEKVEVEKVSVLHPWEDPSLDWETRMRAGKKEADRVGHPIVVSNAKGIVMLPEVQTSYGPPQLSVYTPPYVRRR